MSVFVQNIVDMLADYVLWVAILKKEFSRIIEGLQIVARNQMNKEGSSNKWGSGWGFFFVFCGVNESHFL